MKYWNKPTGKTFSQTEQCVLRSAALNKTVWKCVWCTVYLRKWVRREYECECVISLLWFEKKIFVASRTPRDQQKKWKGSQYKITKQSIFNGDKAQKNWFTNQQPECYDTCVNKTFACFVLSFFSFSNWNRLHDSIGILSVRIRISTFSNRNHWLHLSYL